MIAQRHTQRAKPTAREPGSLSFEYRGEQQEKQEEPSYQQDQATDQAAFAAGGDLFLSGPGRFPLPHTIIIRGNPGGVGHVPRSTQ